MIRSLSLETKPSAVAAPQLQLQSFHPLPEQICKLAKAKILVLSKVGIEVSSSPFIHQFKISAAANLIVTMSADNGVSYQKIGGDRAATNGIEGTICNLELETEIRESIRFE